MGFSSTPKTTYVSVVGGKFRIGATEGAPGAVKRNITDKDGNVKGEKWEYVHDELTCFINKVTERYGKFGRETQVSCEIENKEQVLITLSENSKYASDFLKRVPNVNPSRFVVMSPFDFTDDNGKIVQGILIYQDGNKLTTYYRDENKNAINGAPTLTKEDIDLNRGNSKFWRRWFEDEYEFLLNAAMKLDFDVERENQLPTPTYKAHDKYEAHRAEVKANIDMHANAGKETSVAQDFNPNSPNLEPDDDLPF